MFSALIGKKEGGTMRLTGEQMQSISKNSETQLSSRIASILRVHDTDAAAEDLRELQQAIQEEISKARQYGLQSDFELAAYTMVAWCLGRDFDTRFPAARKTLNNPNMLPADKGQWLTEWNKKIFETLAGRE